MQKVYAKVVSNILTIEQKETRKNVSSLDATTKDRNFLVTYDPKNSQFMNWKGPTSPKANKKAQISKSKFKAMMIVISTFMGL